MRWEDIEQMADIYERSLRTMPSREVKEGPLLRVLKTIDVEEERAWMEKAVQSLKLEEFLRAVRDEKWQTGTVEPFQMDWDRTHNLPALGYSLKSNEYPVVKFSGTGKKMTAALTTKQISLNLYVTPQSVEYHPRKVHIADDNTFRLKGQRYDSFYDAMEDLGVEQGLRKTATPVSTQAGHIIRDPDEIFGVAHAIRELNLDREDQGCLPLNIERWAQNIVRQIPELERSGSMDAKQLREWVYAKRGTGFWPRVFDRILTTRFGL